MSQLISSRAAASVDWQSYFNSLADAIERLQQSGETTLSSFAGEQSDFIRFNAGKVRQTGSVSQGKLTLRLIDGARQAYSTLTVCGDLQQDLDDVSSALAALREGLRDAADDPHLLFDTTKWSRVTQRSGKLPDPGNLSRVVAECAKGLDFVGFYAGGTIVRGFASTSGSRGWYEVDNFNFSWSLYDPSGRAIKTTYAGDDWSDAVFANKVEQAATRLTVLARAPRALSPGRYRSWIAPAALAELLGVASWAGFSARAQASSRSELYKLHTGEVTLDPRVTISEDLTLGITPGFNDDGYLRDSVALIEAGRSVERLTNARSAREYGLTPNGALPNESPVALSMEAGDLREEDVLAKLGTGLYIGNLWYVNFSDRMNCRLTGMTRFATFWVEDGEIVAPLEAMRFDDSLYRLLGGELEQLGAEAELQLSDSTWGERATGGMQLPGILVRSFELTL
ncbi:Predicted Zn-dependent protease or its inactivated homolog [Paraburkholderia fungorum]|uniref:Predicted Zn-dependent protease or its inactivated homolog n=1 Tax=Paraburkholderia fungorum TaxID=134537 RepID=A0A1H1AYX7_9BURK|nr:TldD/PmbA family protein [Paraburkholderia fungorum]SDQ44874.1 Predicted Zn-dependent protease or its inactivated homolog [Paraburkholderia fungorum]